MKIISIAAFLLPAYLFCAAMSFSLQVNGVDYNRETGCFELQAESGWVYTTAPGSYQLPVRTVNVILPPNATDVSPSFSISGVKSFAATQPRLNTPYTDGENYLGSNPALQPSSHIIYQGTGKWGTVKYARFALIPALYDKASESYSVAEQVNISISYNTDLKEPIKSTRLPNLLRKDPSFLNPETLADWYPQSDLRTYDYLVVTTPALYTAAMQLVDFRLGQGLVTSFADINQVLANWGGATPAEKLRNFLVAEYTDSPFTYLLLIGDIDVVPIAMLMPEPNGTELIPSDFYYSDLSSDFDSDFDGLLGEYDSGMDYTPEVMVGRIPWNDASIVSQICTRIVNFETTDLPWKHKTLLPAAMLNYAEEVPGYERTDGATFMEYCKNTILRNHQNTTMYEQSGLLPSYPSDYALNESNLSLLVNSESWGLVNWSAHGSATTSARKIWANDSNSNNLPDPQELQWYGLVSTDTYANPVNQDGSVYFSASCQNGMIDNDTPSLGEILIANKSVANIAATRNGWYKLGWANPGWGGLTSYNYHFLENYVMNGMTVGEAHGYANWLHTQYCLFGDPIDSGGIIWPELQNVYTYLMFGDPAIGYPSQNNSPAGSILIWEPMGDTGTTIINGLHDLAPFNVVYTKHLIDTYDYLNQFDAVFCLFGLGYGPDNYYLQPGSYEYNYLLSYLQQGGKVYMEGMVPWSATDPLFGRFGTEAPFDHLAFIELLRYTHDGIDQFWGYDGYNGGTQALINVGETAQPLFSSYNQFHVNDIIGVWNGIDGSRTISSSFNLSGINSDNYLFSDFLAIILDTLDVYHTLVVSNDDDHQIPLVLRITAYPNPFSGNLTIAAKGEKPLLISIYNIKGQQVKTFRITPEGGTAIWNWDGRDTDNKKLAAGIYLVKATDGTHSRLVKTLKLK
jgi:hypothetical protein